MLARTTSLKLGLAATAAALWMMLPAPAPAQQVIQLQTALDPTGIDPNASGAASYQRTQQDQTFNVMVRNIFSSNPVDIFVNDTYVATLHLTQGFGVLDLDANAGDDVPVIAEGDVLTVFDASDQTAILIGTFFRPGQLQATLEPAGVDPNASGAGNYQRTQQDRTLNVTVRSIFSSNPVDIFVNDDYVATLSLVQGNGTLSLDALRGDDVPDIAEGDVLTVFTADDQTAILIGTFIRTQSGQLQATLRPAAPDPNASGAGNYQRTQQDQTFNVMVRNIFSSNPVDIFVNDTYIATLSLGQGSGVLRLDANAGDDVPVITDGDVLTVFDASDQTPILIGRFVRIR